METCSWLLSLFFKLCTMLVCLTLILTWLRQRLKVIRFSFDDERYQLQSNEAHHVHLMLESDSCCIPPVYTVPPGPLKSLWDRNFGMRCWGLSLEPSVTHRFLQLLVAFLFYLDFLLSSKLSVLAACCTCNDSGVASLDLSSPPNSTAHLPRLVPRPPQLRSWRVAQWLTFW